MRCRHWNGVGGYAVMHVKIHGLGELVWVAAEALAPQM